MPGRPLVLLGICCAAAAALGPTLVLDTAPSPPRSAVAVARTSPADLTARVGELVDAPWVVHPAVRPLLPDVDVLLVRDPAAGPATGPAARASSAARAAGRPLHAVTAPAGGLAGLQAAVRAAGPPTGSGRVVLWLPGPSELRCSPPDTDRQRAVADLVGRGARVLPVHEPGAAPSCTGAATAAGRVATGTGGAAVTSDDLTGPQGALTAATVQLRLEPVCEAGLAAVADLAPRTALSGTRATGRWAVRVEPDAPEGAVLSCVLLAHVDGAPALDAVQALTVRVAAGPGGPRPSTSAEPRADAALLEDVGEQLLDVRRLRGQLRDAVRRGAPAQAVEAVLAALADREHDVEDQHRELAQGADAPVPAGSPTGAPGAPARPGPGPGSTGLASADTARRAVEHALAQIGDPYVWGATGPSTFDCSGLTSTAYAAAGVRIPRVSRDQFYAGVPVAQQDLLPGDLVFYARNAADPRTVHHVAMALGEGRMVHAPQTGDVVRVVALRTRGWAGAVRIVGAVAAPAGPVAVTLPAVPRREPPPRAAEDEVPRGFVLPGALPRPVARPPTTLGATPSAPATSAPVPAPVVVTSPVAAPARPSQGAPEVLPPGGAVPPVEPEPVPNQVAPRPAVPDPPVSDRPPVVVRPPVTPPVVVQPPVVRPPVPQPPVLQPPVLQPPVLQPPVLQPPVLQPPVVRPPPIVLPLEPPIFRVPVLPRTPVRLGLLVRP